MIMIIMMMVVMQCNAMQRKNNADAVWSIRPVMCSPEGISEVQNKR